MRTLPKLAAATAFSLTTIFTPVANANPPPSLLEMKAEKVEKAEELASCVVGEIKKSFPELMAQGDTSTSGKKVDELSAESTTKCLSKVTGVAEDKIPEYPKLSDIYFADVSGVDPADEKKFDEIFKQELIKERDSLERYLSKHTTFNKKHTTFNKFVGKYIDKHVFQIVLGQEIAKMLIQEVEKSFKRPEFNL